MQQAFLNAYAAVRSGDAELRLRPWLYRIAHNASLNLLRQNGWTHEPLDERIDGVETPPQALERNERLRSVLAAVSELPERQRDALVLRALAGRSYDEIAAELGVTGGAVRQLLNRARNSLRSGLGALIPHGVLLRIAAAGGDGSAIDGALQASARAGGIAGVAKLGTAIVVAGAVVGGTTHGIGGASSSHRHATARHSVVAHAAATTRRASVTATLAAHSGARSGGNAGVVRVNRAHRQHHSGRPAGGSIGSGQGERHSSSSGSEQRSGSSGGGDGSRRGGGSDSGGDDHGGSGSTPPAGGEQLTTRSDGGGSGSGSGGSDGGDGSGSMPPSSTSQDGEVSGDSASGRDVQSGDSTAGGSSGDESSTGSGSR